MFSVFKPTKLLFWQAKLDIIYCGYLKHFPVLMIPPNLTQLRVAMDNRVQHYDHQFPYNFPCSFPFHVSISRIIQYNPYVAPYGPICTLYSPYRTFVSRFKGHLRNPAASPASLDEAAELGFRMPLGLDANILGYVGITWGSDREYLGC